MTWHSRWTIGGGTYVFLVMALGTAAAADSDGSSFYLVAIVATIPSCAILYPLFLPIVVLAAMVTGVGVDGSGPSWALQPLLPLFLGVAAVANVVLAWLVVRGARPCGQPTVESAVSAVDEILKLVALTRKSSIAAG